MHGRKKNDIEDSCCASVGRAVVSNSDIRGSNPVIGKFYLLLVKLKMYCKDKNEAKRGPSTKKDTTGWTEEKYRKKAVRNKDRYKKMQNEEEKAVLICEREMWKMEMEPGSSGYGRRLMF